MAAAGPPPGYERITMPGLVAVARPSCAAALRDVLRAESLYAHAARHPERRQHVGRAPAYAIPLGPELRVVVRHSRHGGLLAPLTGDRFLAPTRAPHELRTALRLADAGVPTPEVMATVVYHAAPLLRTADVATRERRSPTRARPPATPRSPPPPGCSPRSPLPARAIRT